MGDRSQGTNPNQGLNAQAQGDGTGGQNQRNPNRNPPPRPQADLNAQDNIMPSENDLAAVAGEVTSNSVATKETVKEILSTLQARRTNATPKDLFSLAWACYHNGLSKFTTLTMDAPCGDRKSVV